VCSGREPLELSAPNAELTASMVFRDAFSVSFFLILARPSVISFAFALCDHQARKCRLGLSSAAWPLARSRLRTCSNCRTWRKYSVHRTSQLVPSILMMLRLRVECLHTAVDARTLLGRTESSG
jgi:hypothetical protein